MKVPPLRRGFAVKPPVQVPEVEPVEFYTGARPVIYYTAKLSHTGITGWKVFENYGRKVHANSMANLLSFQREMNPDFAPREKEEKKRKLNEKQARAVKSQCQKLSFYSATRQFKSKKSGSYKFRVAFLTLTCPDGTDHDQATVAFDHFLHYLSRTANCVYVWKKELGEKNHGLHFHVLINNFIPYYIISWKWKRLLINQGVSWPLNSKGVHTDSHYRIELPRSRRQVSHYISKYMSKGFELPSDCGYVSGHSPILDECEELRLIEGEWDTDELNYLKSLCRTVSDSYVTHICVNLTCIREVAPKLFALFEQQYIAFCDKLTLPQKFTYVG